MRLTIIAGEHVSSLEISPDMKMENFLALCKIELPPIASVPIEKLAFTCSGRNFIANAGLATKRLQELNIRDEDAIQFELISASSTSYQTPYSYRLTPSSSTKSAHLLYIRMMIKNQPVIACVDIGAQYSIVSESCARRCDILKDVDRHHRMDAIGIGGSEKMVGRILACEVQVQGHIFAWPFEVMADRDIDVLFGLDLMLRHECVINLSKMVLRFGDGMETPFLSEQEVKREKQTIALEEVMQTAEGTKDETKKN
uniref:Aspartic peptidase DDI1-type domain-containing protein n=1 Tax=Globodera rostochiensis TaxID=31243 RepID=A0A914HET4_GLORO